MFLSRRPDRIDWLKKVPLFSGLSGRDLDLIARQTDVVKADAGKVLTRQGALGRVTHALEPPSPAPSQSETLA